MAVPMVEFEFMVLLVAELPPLPTLEPPQALSMTMPATANAVNNRANTLGTRLRPESQRIEFFMTNLPEAPLSLLLALRFLHLAQGRCIARAAQPGFFSLLPAWTSCRRVKTNFAHCKFYNTQAPPWSTEYVKCAAPRCNVLRLAPAILKQLLK
jgi:hypothetical protein